jgi:hypothetical protein
LELVLSVREPRFCAKLLRHDNGLAPARALGSAPSPKPLPRNAWQLRGEPNFRASTSPRVKKQYVIGPIEVTPGSALLHYGDDLGPAGANSAKCAHPDSCDQDAGTRHPRGPGGAIAHRGAGREGEKPSITADTDQTEGPWDGARELGGMRLIGWLILDVPAP